MQTLAGARYSVWVRYRTSVVWLCISLPSLSLVCNLASRGKDLACTHLLTPLKRLLRLLPELQPRRALSWAALLSEDLPDNPDSWAASGWLPVRSRLPLPPSLLSPAAL